MPRPPLTQTCRRGRFPSPVKAWVLGHLDWVLALQGHLDWVLEHLIGAWFLGVRLLADRDELQDVGLLPQRALKILAT